MEYFYIHYIVSLFMWCRHSVFGEVAKSAECGLFVQCWQGLGRNCHGKVVVKTWYKFTNLSHSRFISRSVVELPWGD
jgi:hypothetical protein